MLHVLTLNEQERWNDIVRSFSDYDVYYLTGYVKGFQLHGDGVPFLFYYEGENMRAINVVMKRDIAKTKAFEGILTRDSYFDFATPYGYGGWLIEGNGDISILMTEYGEWCRTHNIVSEFVRFHPLLENEKYVSEYYDITMIGNTVTMDLSSEDTIWENLSSKNRNVIRKAQKSGVRICRDTSKAIFELFQTMYEETMRRNQASEYYYFGENYYQSLAKDLHQEAQVFYAVFEEQVIAASIIIGANGRLNYHLSGSKKEYGSYAATNLLLYEAALWGSANGYKTMHLGGGVGAQKDRLFAFKRAFSRGELREYHIGRKIYMDQEYEMLCEKRGGSRQETFFPAYRA